MEPAPAPVVSGPPHAGVAVLRLERVYEECSGLGGAHVIFSVVSFSAGGGIQRAYFGGHGVYGFVEDDVGRYYVAEVIPRPATHRVHSPGWCVDDLPSYDGLAGALIAAADRADAERRADAIVDEVGAAAWSSPSQPRTCAGEDPSSIEGQGCVVRWHRSWSGR